MRHDNVEFSGKYIQLPNVSSAVRDGLGLTGLGYTIFNTDTHVTETFNGTSWVAGGGGSTGSGSQGSTGAQGVQGATGFQGTTGLQGTQGATGVRGATGPNGVQGVTGIQGAIGSSGTQGITGTQGGQGTTGIQGTQGNTGTQGLTGYQGSTGTQGVTGPQGVTGSQGATGLQGSTGTAGYTGIQGTQGSTGLAGAANSVTSNGVTGLGSSPAPLGLSSNQILPYATVSHGAAGVTGLVLSSTAITASMPVTVGTTGAATITLTAPTANVAAITFNGGLTAGGGGSVGKASSGSDLVYVTNNQAAGVVLQAGGATVLTASSTAVTVSVPIYATKFITPNNALFADSGTYACMWGQGLTPDLTNFSFLINKTGSATILNASSVGSMDLRIGNLSRILITDTVITASVPLVGKYYACNSVLGDVQDGAPWYGVGYSTVVSGGGFLTQLAGYNGVRVRSSTATLDVLPASIIASVPIAIPNAYSAATALDIAGGKVFKATTSPMLQLQPDATVAGMLAISNSATVAGVYAYNQDLSTWYALSLRGSTTTITGGSGILTVAPASVGSNVPVTSPAFCTNILQSSNVSSPYTWSTAGGAGVWFLGIITGSFTVTITGQLAGMETFVYGYTNVASLSITYALAGVTFQFDKSNSSQANTYSVALTQNAFFTHRLTWLTTAVCRIHLV